MYKRQAIYVSPKAIAVMQPKTTMRIAVRKIFFFKAFFFCILVITYPPWTSYSKTLDFRMPVGMKVRIMMSMPKEMQSL